MDGAAIRNERGLSLIELLVVMGLLIVVVGGFYALLTTTDRGWSLLQGQLDTQQGPRVATDRLVNDLQQALDNAVGGNLTVQKITIIVCPVAATATTSVILVQNATDISTNAVVTMTALATNVTNTTVSAIGTTTTCASNGAIGTSLTITPSVTSATAMFGLPYGTLLSPVPVTYLRAGTLLQRGGQVLADIISGLSFTQVATTLAATAPAGVTTPTVSSTTGLAVGDLIFVGAEIRSISSVAGSTLNLDQGLFFAHPSGETVRKKIVTTQMTGTFTQPQAGGGQVQNVNDPSEGVPRNPPLK